MFALTGNDMFVTNRRDYVGQLTEIALALWRKSVRKVNVVMGAKRRGLFP